MVSAILAISKNNCIGKDGGLPWPKIPEDMKWFQNTTRNNIVVMGSSTWHSLGEHKPLKKRINVVISSQEMRDFPGVHEVVSHDLPEDLLALKSLCPDKEIYIIGGAQIYELCAPIVDTWYVTRIDEEYDGDTFLDVDELIGETKQVQSFKVKDNTPNLPKYTFEIHRK